MQRHSPPSRPGGQPRLPGMRRDRQRAAPSGGVPRLLEARTRWWGGPVTTLQDVFQRPARLIIGFLGAVGRAAPPGSGGLSSREVWEKKKKIGRVRPPLVVGAPQQAEGPLRPFPLRPKTGFRALQETSNLALSRGPPERAGTPRSKTITAHLEAWAHLKLDGPQIKS